jgi:hypothetical protein
MATTARQRADTRHAYTKTGDYTPYYGDSGLITIDPLTGMPRTSVTSATVNGLQTPIGNTAIPSLQQAPTSANGLAQIPGIDNGEYSVNTYNGTPTDTGTSMFGKDGIVGGVAAGVSAAAGLANGYLGYKNYGLAKDKFGFEKAATNRNIANQASQYNTELQNRGEVGIGLAGNSMSSDQVAARNAQLASQKISGAAIG